MRNITEFLQISCLNPLPVEMAVVILLLQPGEVIFPVVYCTSHVIHSPPLCHLLTCGLWTRARIGRNAGWTRQHIVVIGRNHLAHSVKVGIIEGLPTSTVTQGVRRASVDPGGASVLASRYCQFPTVPLPAHASVSSQKLRAGRGIMPPQRRLHQGSLKQKSRSPERCSLLIGELPRGRRRGRSRSPPRR